MQRLIAALAITFLFVPSGLAQEQQDSRCRVRFAVVQRQDTGTFKVQPDDQDLWGQWPVDARQWWAKDGNKKYAELCEAPRGDAEFVVAWEKEAITKRPFLLTAQLGGCDGDAQPRQDFPRGDYTCVGTRVPTVWLDRVSVTMYRVEKEPQQFAPLFSLAKESSPDRGAGKKALESALQALRKEVRKSSRR